MKVLVLGGTGAMGVHLVNLLAECASRVVVTSRSRSGREGSVEYATGNARDETFISGLLSERWDAIVDFMVYSTQEFQDKYRQFLQSTDQYVYLSSSRVYADSAQPLTENSPRLLDVSDDQVYLATDEYALTKARQENLLFQSSEKNWTIIRPYITYSDQRLQLGVLEKEDWLYRVLHNRTIVTSQDIQSKTTTLTTGYDVARGIVAILGKPNALGEAFHITSDESISWQQVLDTYLAVLEPHLASSPKVLLQGLDSFMQWRSGTYQITCDRLYDRRFDNSKINQYIDTSDFMRPQDGLAQCLQDFVSAKKPSFSGVNWREEAAKDRLLGERASLSEMPGFKQKLKYFIFRDVPVIGQMKKL